MKKAFFILLLVALAACKKKDWKGSYSGTEELTIVSTSDSIYSSFQQSVSIDFRGRKCEFNSSTINWEFLGKEKKDNVYTHDQSGTVFTLEFRDDSLIADFKSGDQEYTRRHFRGKRQ